MQTLLRRRAVLRCSSGSLDKKINQSSVKVILITWFQRFKKSEKSWWISSSSNSVLVLWLTQRRFFFWVFGFLLLILTVSVSFFHTFLFLHFNLESSIPNTFISSSRASFYLFLGLSCFLGPKSVHRVTFLIISFGFLLMMCPERYVWVSRSTDRELQQRVL